MKNIKSKKKKMYNRKTLNPVNVLLGLNIWKTIVAERMVNFINVNGLKYYNLQILEDGGG